MNAVKVTSKFNVHLKYIPKRLVNREQKDEINPNVNAEFNSTELNNIPVMDCQSTSALAQPIKNMNTTKYRSRIKNIGIGNDPKVKITDKSLNSLVQVEQVAGSSSNCFERLSSMDKSILKIMLGILIVVCVIATIVLPPVFVLVVFKSDPSTTIATTTMSPCSSATCIGQETPYRTSMVTVLYPFNGNANDSTGQLAGILYGSPTFVSQSYVGTQALLLNSPGSNQYLEIPYVDFISRSFTIQLWIYPSATTLQNDYGIFSQCDSNLTCLSISLREGRCTLSFDSMNITNNSLVSATVIPLREWTHLTIVYDALLYQQKIYVNGRIDAMSTGIVAPFRRISPNSTTYVGRSRSNAYGITFFIGRIDHLTISVGSVRTACQINNDVSLTAYYPFNADNFLNDYSINLFDGITSNTTLISEGRIGQAIYFPFNTSYFQAQCFPAIRNFTNTSPQLTLSLWINPTMPTSGGSIVHISSLPYGNGSLCYDLLALSSTGALVVQLASPTSSAAALQGPILPANTWTNVAVIYSQNDGIRLFINSQLVATSTAFPVSLIRWDTPLYVTLGNSNTRGVTSGITCSSSGLPYISGSFTGAIDDFRLYNRELNLQEICTLANL